MIFLINHIVNVSLIDNYLDKKIDYTNTPRFLKLKLRFEVETGTTFSTHICLMAILQVQGLRTDNEIKLLGVATSLFYMNT